MISEERYPDMVPVSRFKGLFFVILSFIGIVIGIIILSIGLYQGDAEYSSVGFLILLIGVILAIRFRKRFVIITNIRAASSSSPRKIRVRKY